MARAGRIGTQGRQAATFGFSARPDTFNRFLSDEINPDQTEAITDSRGILPRPPASPSSTAASPLMVLSYSVSQQGRILAFIMGGRKSVFGGVCVGMRE